MRWTMIISDGRTWLAALSGPADDEVFLMNFRSENSLDGRYFGPLPVSTIGGHADPLWTNEGN
jgi:type IV secretory pathway protease TraF